MQNCWICKKCSVQLHNCHFFQFPFLHRQFKRQNIGFFLFGSLAFVQARRCYFEVPILFWNPHSGSSALKEAFLRRPNVLAGTWRRTVSKSVDNKSYEVLPYPGVQWIFISVEVMPGPQALTGARLLPLAWTTSPLLFFAGGMKNYFLWPLRAGMLFVVLSERIKRPAVASYSTT